MALARVAVTPGSRVSGHGRSAQDISFDVNRLMDGVREEVAALMADSVQKAASFCASLCAERVVAARREMQRRFAEDRRELEQLYGVGRAHSNGGGGSSFAASCSNAHLPGGAPPPPPAPSLTRTIFFASGRDGDATTKCGVNGGTVVAPSAFPPHASPPRTVTARGLPTDVAQEPTQSAGKRMPSVLGHVGGAASLESYDASFNAAYDAVQSLESQTSMAARAMDLLDEVLHSAVDVQGGRDDLPLMEGQSIASKRTQLPQLSRSSPDTSALAPSPDGSQTVFASPEGQEGGEVAFHGDLCQLMPSSLAAVSSSSPAASPARFVVHQAGAGDTWGTPMAIPREPTEEHGHAALREHEPSVAPLSSSRLSAPSADLHGS